MVESHYVDVITEKYEKDIPYRTKEVGEGYVSGMVAAIANAVYDATGVRVKTLPILPEKILMGLEKGNQKDSLRPSNELSLLGIEEKYGKGHHVETGIGDHAKR